MLPQLRFHIWSNGISFNMGQQIGCQNVNELYQGIFLPTTVLLPQACCINLLHQPELPSAKSYLLFAAVQKGFHSSLLLFVLFELLQALVETGC